MSRKSIFYIFFLLIILVGCKEEENNAKEVANLSGEWTGEIEIPNQPLGIRMTFDEQEDVSGNISIPVQGIQNYPLSSVTMKEDKNIVFILDIQGQYMIFEGHIEEDKVTGTFKQNGQSFPFELKKGESILSTEEEEKFLQVETSAGTLYGELLMPSGEGPFPIAIIIPGSGPTDRNGNSTAGENNSLKMLAEGLAENGVATLRYDKRGAGKNQLAVIPEEEMRFDQFIEDAVDWVELLEENPNFSDVGIIGHSQGSLVGMLTAQKTNVDYFISIAGAGRSIDQVLYQQLQEQLSDKLLAESKEIVQALKQGERVENVSPQLESIFRPSVQPFTASWMKYEPVEEIAKLEIPILIINGENDLQVPIEDAELLKDAKRDAELLLIESMNHVLKDAPTDREGNLETYSNPTLPISERLIDGINQFLVEN
ncbi:hypothetical protein SAMN05216389_104107 [Oceanobacillus limi]|uniref:Serine aminopeptidase S33 domain-containing protein n=1 Tax=Oceanobacillus limi TaxID=930131 RepID=A0A1I0B1E0_9BACI|nr:alpha/beta hydrolase [Oceanobacillus limi]SES99752.1 hypothetical protein SAMN05216389_104107 [Oceanobacillus limi]